MGGATEMSNRGVALSHDHLQAESRRWWETNPMSYDWHRTLGVEEGTREFYEEVDRRFFSSSSFYRGSRPFERYIPYDRLREARVLEIGCGLGSHARLLAEAGSRLSCIDLTERAVLNTRRRLQLWGLQADVQQMDAEEMQFPDNHFDLVWSWGVIHHSPNTTKIIQQVHRVLRPGGEFRVMVYHRRSLSGLYCLARGLLSGKVFKGMSVPEILSFYTDGYMARFYTRSGWSALLRESGFTQVETRVLGQKSELIPLPGKGPGGRVKRAILRGIPDRMAEIPLSVAGYFLFAIARKGADSPTT